MTCAAAGEFRSAALMVRSLFIYLTFQLLARLLPRVAPQPPVPQ